MRHTYNLEAWKALVIFEQTGSLSGAAEVMNVEVSTVSRLIDGLERALGRRFVKRDSRPAVITGAGHDAAARMKPILEAHESLIDELAADAGSMKGTIRLAVAGGLQHSKLMPMLQEFKILYPDIDFDIHSGRMVAECLNGTIDVASISGPESRRRLVVMPRGRSVFIPVASPSYIREHGKPMRPEDLAAHAGFVYAGPVRSPTTMLEKDGEVRAIAWRDHIQSTDILMIKNAVLDGLGVAVDLPLLHCAEELASGRLRIILDGWHRPPLEAFAVCSRSSWHVRRIRIFMEWWCKVFRAEFERTEGIVREILGNAASGYLEEGAARK